jgi:phosphoglycolate phosphatase
LRPDYELLIFDWDGTLSDSIGRIVEAMQAAAHLAGRSVRDDVAIKGIIGLAGGHSHAVPGHHCQ